MVKQKNWRDNDKNDQKSSNNNGGSSTSNKNNVKNSNNQSAEPTISLNGLPDDLDVYQKDGSSSFRPAGTVGSVARNRSNLSSVPAQPSIKEYMPSVENYQNRLIEVQDEAYKRTHAQVSEISGALKFPSSLDFERVVNEYTIQATRDRIFVAEDEVTEQDADGGKVADANKNTEGEPLISTDKDGDYKTYSDSEHEEGQPPPPPPPNQRRKRVKPGKFGYTGRTATRWVLANVTGLLTGCTSVFIVACTSFLNDVRSNLLNTLWRRNQNVWSIFVIYLGLNLAMATATALLCTMWSPEAKGSGIPEVKAFLNGVRVTRFASFTLYFVKVVGTILSIASGFIVGPEGPLVHIGAVIGASCTKLANFLLHLLPRRCMNATWEFVTNDLSHFSRDSERRDLVSIGAGAGFAAAFGAPIGGLLFSLEEASTYFDHSMFFKTLTATAVSTFCLAVYHGDLSKYSIISLGSYQTNDSDIFVTRAEELPLYVVVAVGGGVLGGVFCRVWTYLQVLRKDLFPRTGAQKIAQVVQVVLVSIITSTITYWVPLSSWACRAVNADDDIAEEFDPYEFHAHQFNCARGEINEIATIFFGAREEVIGDVLTNPSQFQAKTLWYTGFIFFALMTCTLGIAIPSGIFMPSCLIGVSLGSAAGLTFEKWLGAELSPSTFGLLGAAALLAGTQRSTVSLCVILVEGTGHVKVLIPVIVTVVIARWVGDKITAEGLYHLGMEVSKYPYLSHAEKKRYDIFQCKEIMSAPCVCIAPYERAYRIVKLLRDTQHHGFPVVDPDTKQFLGLVRRDQLVALLECGVFQDEDSRSETETDVSSSSGSNTPSQWTPKPGIGESQYMRKAFHIADDHYDSYADSQPLNKSKATKDDDAYSWLVDLEKIRARMARNRKEGATKQRLGDETMPPMTAAEQPLPKNSFDEFDEDTQFAMVGTNAKGNVYVKWLHPSCKRKWVYVQGVMNRGCYVVNDFTPVSKAHQLFTSMGLRHLVVLGSDEDNHGDVVGMITRINLLGEFIEERTGCELH